MKRALGVVTFVIPIACSDPPPPPASAAQDTAPPEPVALHGTWVRTTQGNAASDTLVLRPDSSARGWIDDRGQRIRFSRWRVAYLSTEPPEARVDRGMKLQDGGDADCTFKSRAGCRSGPVLCVESGAEDRCFVFTFRRDSLKISTNTWYIRVPAGAADSLGKNTAT